MIASAPLALRKLRDLDCAGEPGFISAASGLVRANGRLYVAADDELHLAVFPAVGTGPGRRIRLFDGELPRAKAERKRAKPDMEALVLLPPAPDLPHGGMLALGSGSTPGRRRGALLAFDALGGLSGPARHLDLSGIYTLAWPEMPELNVEGAVISEGSFLLFHRGNRTYPASAVARFNAAALLDALIMDPGMKPPAPLSIERLALGSLRSVPFSVTDAAALPDGEIMVTAVAEDTANAYDDGACIGAAMFRLSREGAVLQAWMFDRPYKVEGIALTVAGDTAEVLLVTDADDPTQPAGLYSATVALGAGRSTPSKAP